MPRLTLQTPVFELGSHELANLSAAMSKKLGVAIAPSANKADPYSATIEDILNYFPMRYEDRSNLIQIDELTQDMEASLDLYVRVSGGFRVGKNRGPKAPPLFIFEITAGDLTGTRKPVVVWWFVSGKQASHAISYYQRRFSRGTRIVAYGKWEWDSRRNTFSLRLGKPDELEVLPLELELGSATDQEPLVKKNDEAGVESEDLLDDSNEFPLIHVGRRVPIYRKLGPFQTKRIREIVYGIFQKLDSNAIAETLPKQLVDSNQLVSRRRAIEEIHFPADTASLTEYANARSDAHKRLIFEEFFRVAFALQFLRGERTRESKPAKIELDERIRLKLKGLLPFKLTNAQERVIKEIFGDMTSDYPMNRLVQGDVGSGKTIVAALAMVLAMENGYQTAMMAPTEILAEQHARNFRKLLDGTGFNVGLLVGSLKAKEKRDVQAGIADGTIHAVIGTHAVIQDSVEFKNLGLAVIDEQHRFGVLQRSALTRRGANPDVLVMTATPIPRSLAMTVYGDLDVSVIDELPPGRTPIKTVVLGEDQRGGVYKGIRREVELGRQVYVVYPLIDESEKTDLKAATAMFEELRDKIFPEYTVGLLHGKMKAEEKDSVMTAFGEGKLQILVSTTVIEVGVDVPNASLMIIEHSERFGLSQLHQLRGRVGRGAEQSFCVLLTGDKKTAVAKERLGIMEETTDGFRIAEKDLEIRGQGDILGTRQSGVQSFKIGNIIRDFEILKIASREAERLLTMERQSSVTIEMIRQTERDNRVKLAEIG